MKVISIANAKGGVGKTSLSINISYEIQRKKYNVLMLDLDRQCDLTKVYLPPYYKGPTIADVLQKRASMKDALVPITDNLFLVSGSPKIDTFNFNNTKAIRRLLQDLEGIDYVIIDHPPALNHVTLSGFVASDEVLIVSDTESFSISNLNTLLEDLEQIKQKYNPALHILGIVLNRMDMRRNLTKTAIKKCTRAFGDYLFNTKISNNTAVPISISQGIPVRKLKWQGPIIPQLNDLIHEMFERMEVI